MIEITENNKKNIAEFLEGLLPSEVISNLQKENFDVEKNIEIANNKKKELLKNDINFTKEIIGDRLGNKVAELRKKNDKLVRRLFGLSTTETANSKFEEILENQVNKLKKGENTSYKELEQKYNNLNTEFEDFKENSETILTNKQNEWNEKYLSEKKKEKLNKIINKVISEKATKNVSNEAIFTVLENTFKKSNDIQLEGDTIKLVDKDGNLVQNGKDFVKVEDKLEEILLATKLKAKNNNNEKDQNSKPSDFAQNEDENKISILERAKQALEAEKNGK